MAIEPQPGVLVRLTRPWEFKLYLCKGNRRMAEMFDMEPPPVLQALRGSTASPAVYWPALVRWRDYRDTTLFQGARLRFIDRYTGGSGVKFTHDVPRRRFPGLRFEWIPLGVRFWVTDGDAAKMRFIHETLQHHPGGHGLRTP